MVAKNAGNEKEKEREKGELKIHFKNLTLVMTALVCGAIAAGSASVSAFAGLTSGHANAPISKYTEARALKLAPAQNGQIKVIVYYNGYADCDSMVTIQLIPDPGYKEDGIFTGIEYVDQAIEGSNGCYTFKMPWCDPKSGVTVTGQFSPVNGDDKKNDQNSAASAEEDTETKEQTPAEATDESAASEEHIIDFLPTVDVSVICNQWSAKAGEEVMFTTETVTDDGLVTPVIISSKTNKPVPNTPVKLEEDLGGGMCTYSFIMPDEDVLLYATFESTSNQ